MICLICRGAEIGDERTSISLERGEMHLVINNVPARVCSACSEAYIDENITVQLLRRAEEFYRLGVLEEVVDFPFRSFHGQL